jgi:hypothetical protein
MSDEKEWLKLSNGDYSIHRESTSLLALIRKD